MTAARVEPMWLRIGHCALVAAPPGPRPLGVFREFRPPTTAPSIRTAIGRGPGEPTQRRAAFYLLQGTPVAAVMEMTPDVIDGEDVYLSASHRSDGDWFWRADLAHYVAKYNLSLDPEFVAHASSYRWSPGVLTADEAGAAANAIHRWLTSA